MAAAENDDYYVAQTHDLRRSYRLRSEEIHALRGVDISINRSEFVTLMGRSGSGKTTLLNILAGLDRPTSGTVTVLGHNIGAMSDEQLARMRRENIGIIFQSSALMPLLTAIENVELPLRILGWARADRERRAHESLEVVAMGHRARHRPYELSGGEQQRIGIARAIAPKPALIIADAPTGELDSVSAQRIFGLFRSLVDDERVTILAATHDRAIIGRADRVLELRDGNLAERE